MNVCVVRECKCVYVCECLIAYAKRHNKSNETERPGKTKKRNKINTKWKLKHYTLHAPAHSYRDTHTYVPYSRCTVTVEPMYKATINRIPKHHC